MPVPNPPEDLEERCAIAVVAVLDTHAQISAITGRANGNVIAWDAEIEVPLPMVAYRDTIATRSGAAPATGDSREVMFLFSAVAATESECNALLSAIEGGIVAPKIKWAPALAALVPPLDGYFYNPVRRNIGWDSDADGYRKDLEYTLVVTK